MEGGDGEMKMRGKQDRHLLLKVWQLPEGLGIQFGAPLFLPVICQIAFISLYSAANAFKEASCIGNTSQEYQ